MSVPYKADGFGNVTPYLMFSNIGGSADFMAKVFGASTVDRIATPDGTPMHICLQLGDSKIMMGEHRDPHPQCPGSLYVYVEDVDSTYRAALDAGAESLHEPEDQFYGDRSCGVRDPFGNYYWLATHIEDVSGEEISRRMQSMGG